MAEEENVVSEESEKDPKASKRPIKKIILAVMVIVFLGGGGFGAWKFFFSANAVDENDPAAAEAEVAEADRSSKVKIMYEMKPFIVNLLGDEGKRYLKAKITAEVGDEAIQEELASRDPEVRDAILLLLAGKSFENISTPEGKSALRTELIARINRVLEKGTIRMLYFTEFVVQ